MNIEGKLKALYQLRQQKTEIQNQLSNTEALIEQAQAEIVDEFESRQIKSMKIEGFGLFVAKVSSYPKVIDHAAMREWMDKNHIDWGVVTAFNTKKFQGFYNELLEQGKELPPGIEQFTKAVIAITKGG